MSEVHTLYSQSHEVSGPSEDLEVGRLRVYKKYAYGREVAEPRFALIPAGNMTTHLAMYMESMVALIEHTHENAASAEAEVVTFTPN